MKDYLNQHHLLDQDADEGQIQIVSARALRIETPPEYTPQIVFGPYENVYFTNYDGILYAKAYPPLAKKFVEDLKKGRISLAAHIALEGYDFQQDLAVITFDDVSDTHYYKNLAGPSGPAWISRNQIANVASEAATSRDIWITTEFDDQDFDKLVLALLATMDKRDEQLTNKWKSLDDFFTREGWDPEDFRADLITRSKLDRNSEYSDKFRQDLKNVASDKTKEAGKRDRYDIDKRSGKAGESGTGTILTRWGLLDYGSAMPRTARVAPVWNGFSRFRSRRGANAVVRESGRLPSIRAGFCGILLINHRCGFVRTR